MHPITSQSYSIDPVTHEWVFADGARIPVFAGGDDGDLGAAVGTALDQTPDDGDPGQQDSTPPATGKKERGPAPWTKDIDAMRESEDPFNAFDEYLRTSIQPRMTKFEQSSAEYDKMFGDMDTARLVSQLMSDLDGNPKETLRRLASGFGVDPVDLLEEIEDQASNETDAPEGSKPEGEPDEIRSWAQQKMEQEKQAAEDAALEKLLGGFEENIPGFNRDLYARLLKSEDYDAEAALETYMQFHREPEKQDDPPPTGGGQKGATPREAPKHGSIAAAMSSFFRDSEAAKA